MSTLHTCALAARRTCIEGMPQQHRGACACRRLLCGVETTAYFISANMHAGVVARWPWSHDTPLRKRRDKGEGEGKCT
jgi:hypothetical protein